MSSETDQPAFDLTTLDVLLNSFSQMASDPKTPRSVFYSTVNRKLAAATESPAAFAFVKNPQNQFRILGMPERSSGSKVSPDSLFEPIKRICQPAVQQAPQGIHPAGQHKIAFARCLVGSGYEFIFCLLRPNSDDALSDQVHQDLASEIVRQIEIFENQQTALRKSRSAVELAQISKLGQDLGKSTNARELAYHLVNDLAKITRADRVTFFSNAGRIRAISGVANVSHQTDIARSLSKVARLASSTTGIEWQGESVQIDAPRHPRGLEQLIQSLQAESGYAIPIQTESTCRGILLLEYFDSDSESRFDRRELINEVIQYATPIVDRSFRDNAIPAFDLQHWFFNRIMIRSARSGLLLISTLLVLAAAAYWLFWLPAPFEIYGEGTLDTIDKHHVFARVEGDVDSIFVKEQARVSKQDPLLRIRSRDLEKDQTTVAGQIEEARTELRTLQVSDFDTAQANPLDEARRASEMKRLKIRLETLVAQQEFFAEKEKQLNVGAPIDGVVTTQQLQQKLLDRPINRGDILMTISRTQGEWELKLDVPDSRIEFIKQAMADAEESKLDVLFRLTVDSSQNFTGKLERLDYRANQSTEDLPATVVAHVSIDEAQLGDSLRIGARVYGKIDCGEQSNFFLLTYEARQRINQWLFQ